MICAYTEQRCVDIYEAKRDSEIIKTCILPQALHMNTFLKGNAFNLSAEYAVLKHCAENGESFQDESPLILTLEYKGIPRMFEINHASSISN